MPKTWKKKLNSPTKRGVDRLPAAVPASRWLVAAHQRPASHNPGNWKRANASERSAVDKGGRWVTATHGAAFLGEIERSAMATFFSRVDCGLRRTKRLKYLHKASKLFTEYESLPIQWTSSCSHLLRSVPLKKNMQFYLITTACFSYHQKGWQRNNRNMCNIWRQSS